MVTVSFAVGIVATSFAEEHNIKVLVVGGSGFKAVPSKNERLRKLDHLNGRLVVGLTSYKGDITIWRSSEGLYLVNKLPLEKYVKGVVKAEVGTNWATEALKAQAVIVRTYVLSQMERAKRPEYHVTSSVLHQVYKGENTFKDIADAVDITRDEILTYEGKPIVAFYHSTSDGSTEYPEEVFGKSYPYLKSVKVSGKLSPYSLWSREIPLREIARALGYSKVFGMRVLSYTASGRVKDIALYTDKGTAFVQGKDFRRKIGWRKVPSTKFDVTLDDGKVHLKGSGYGHGVGLSQWSALEMALDGKNYKEILSHFYPGAEITLNENI